MNRPRWAFMALLFSIMMGTGRDASADAIDIRGQLVRQDGTPIAGQKLRVVIGSERNARAPDSGEVVTTDRNGRFARKLDAPVKKRSISLDNLFVRHPSRFLEVGVELPLIGHRALYWIELDQVRDGTAGQMAAYVAGPNGTFDRMLQFDERSHSWTFPDEPNGMRMSGIGAELRRHDMTGSSDAGWTVDLVIEKHEFAVR